MTGRKGTCPNAQYKLVACLRTNKHLARSDSARMIRILVCMPTSLIRQVLVN
jgi:hypothetical protein